MCLQEKTFLKPGKHFKLLGYNIVRRDREDAKGGLITFVKEGLNFSEVKVTNKLENITVKVNIKGSCLQVINIYIPPGKIVEKNVLEKFTVHSKTLIMGDLNGKSTMWGSESSDERGRLLEEFRRVQGRRCY